jgi:thiol-disulfide isomerase/thioredoxin
LLLGFIAVGVVVAVIFGTQEELLPVASKLPVLNLNSIKGRIEVNASSVPLMIMFFKPDCPHCEYEFEIMNKKINALENINIYFVTTDKKYIQDKTFRKWNKLINKDNIFFASIDEQEYKEKIGINVTPVFLIYNNAGVLVNKIFGETKFDRILGSIKNTGGAQHQ